MEQCRSKENVYRESYTHSPQTSASVHNSLCYEQLSLTSGVITLNPNSNNSSFHNSSQTNPSDVHLHKQTSGLLVDKV